MKPLLLIDTDTFAAKFDSRYVRALIRTIRDVGYQIGGNGPDS